MLEVLYLHAKFGGARISSAAGAAKNFELFLSVCLSVMLIFRVPTNLENLELSGNFVNLEKAGNLRCGQGILYDLSHGLRLA